MQAYEIAKRYLGLGQEEKQECTTSCSVTVAAKGICKNAIIKCPPEIKSGEESAKVEYNYEIGNGAKTKVTITAKVGTEVLGSNSANHDWQWWWTGDWAKVCDSLGGNCEMTINFNRAVKAGETITFEMKVEAR
jgi:hypothetical protein